MSSFLKNTPALILLGIIFVLGAWLWSSYNGLVGSKAELDSAWANVEAQYQRRFDLIPNLQAIVQGAADFEKSTFTAVTAARTQWQNAGSQTEKLQAINNFDSSLSRLLVTVEAYPALKATQNFADFQAELAGTENRITVSRQDYNEAVKRYNVFVKVFPRNLIASWFGYEEAAFFRAAEDAAQAPKVQF